MDNDRPKTNRIYLYCAVVTEKSTYLSVKLTNSMLWQVNLTQGLVYFYVTNGQKNLINFLPYFRRFGVLVCDVITSLSAIQVL